MPPQTNRELTKVSTMENALSAMRKGAEFTFNDRTRPLTVIEESSTKIVAESNRGTKHRFVWGPDYNYPKHIPRQNQTNNVRSLVVKSYGDDSQQLATPLKINWQGDARQKFVSRYLEVAQADGEEPQDVHQMFNRQKTNVVVKTQDELDALYNGLVHMINYRDPRRTTWMTSRHMDAYRRVLSDLKEKMNKRGLQIKRQRYDDS